MTRAFSDGPPRRRAGVVRRLVLVAAAAALGVGVLPAAARAEQVAPRRASAGECTAWRARSGRLAARLDALGHATFQGKRAQARASQLVRRLSIELGGYHNLLVVGCLPLPPLPAQPAGPGPVLSTIPAGLLQNFTFTDAHGPPAIAQAEAERIAGGGIVRGSQLAHCFYTALPPGVPLPTLPPLPGSSGPPQPVQVFTFDRDCWIVSLPGGGVSSGPPGSRHGVLIYHVTLLDAESGAFLMGIAGG